MRFYQEGPYPLTHSQEVDTTCRVRIFSVPDINRPNVGLNSLLNIFCSMLTLFGEQKRPVSSWNIPHHYVDMDLRLFALPHMSYASLPSTKNPVLLFKLSSPRKFPRKPYCPPRPLRLPSPPTLRTPPIPPLPPRLGSPPSKPHNALLLPPPIQTNSPAHHPPFLPRHERSWSDVGPKAVGGEAG